MKKTLAAFALAMLSTQALAFDYFRSMEEDLARKRQLADYQRLEYDTTYQRTQQNSRLMELEQRERKHQAFIRNPNVVAEVLFRANGTCESCRQTAPFIRRTDYTPYLEVHHRTPLSENGDDSIENAIALCPNCHRKAHFG